MKGVAQGEGCCRVLSVSPFISLLQLKDHALRDPVLISKGMRGLLTSQLTLVQVQQRSGQPSPLLSTAVTYEVL